MPTETFDCLVCGAVDPIARVVVREHGQVVACVCSSHTLWDVVRHDVYVNLIAGDDGD